MKHQQFFSNQDKAELRAIIKDKTGYSFTDSFILSQAFRRRSFCTETGGKSNELFEFIGDQVLNFYVVKIITDRVLSLTIEKDYSFRIRENNFTVLKQRFINNEFLAGIIDEWDVAQYLIVGRSDENNEIHKQIKIKADLFESIIGAIAVESNWNPEILENTVQKALNLNERLQSIIDSESHFLCFDIDNAVTVLKELAEKEKCSMPTYEFYPIADSDSEIMWGCRCSIINDITGIHRSVCASSKKIAKKAAAYLVLCEHFQTPNKYGVTTFFPIWIYKNGMLIPDR